LGHLGFFRKFAEIFASQGALLASRTPAVNFATGIAGIVDTGGNPPVSTTHRWQFAAGVNDTGGK
jgi:hypothetical protein